jgi:hypothetical protein
LRLFACRSPHASVGSPLNAFAAIDDDVYGAGLALGNAAGRKAFTEAGTVGAGILTPAALTQDAWIVVTWTTATSAASHTQVWTLAYTLA